MREVGPTSSSWIDGEVTSVSKNEAAKVRAVHKPTVTDSNPIPDHTTRWIHTDGPSTPHFWLKRTPTLKDTYFNSIVTDLTIPMNLNGIS